MTSAERKNVLYCRGLFLFDIPFVKIPNADTSWNNQKTDSYSQCPEHVAMIRILCQCVHIHIRKIL